MIETIERKPSTDAAVEVAMFIAAVSMARLASVQGSTVWAASAAIAGCVYFVLQEQN